MAGTAEERDVGRDVELVVDELGLERTEERVGIVDGVGIGVRELTRRPHGEVVLGLRDVDARLAEEARIDRVIEVQVGQDHGVEIVGREPALPERVVELCAVRVPGAVDENPATVVGGDEARRRVPDGPARRPDGITRQDDVDARHSVSSCAGQGPLRVTVPDASRRRHLDRWPSRR